MAAARPCRGRAALVAAAALAAAGGRARAQEGAFTLDLPRFLFEQHHLAAHTAGLLASTPLGRASMSYVDGVTTEALTHPYGLEFGADGSLFVASFALDHVVRISWSLPGEHARARYRVFAQVDAPVGLAYDARGEGSGGEARTLYVGSFTADLIYAFNDAGELLRAFGDEDELDCPEGMSFGPDHSLYVVSFLTQHVARYDAARGAFLGVFAATAAGGSRAPGALVGPEDLAWALVAPANATHAARWDLFVTSYLTSLVQQFDGRSGAWVRALGAGVLDGPVGIERSPLDPSRLLVASYRANAVHAFDAREQGAFAGVAVGREETDEGGRLRRGGLSGPTALAFSPADLTLFVASYVNSHVLRYNYSASAERYSTYSRVTTTPGGAAAR